MGYPLVIDLIIVIKNSSRKMFVRSVLQTDRFGNFIFEVEDYRYFVYRESPISMMIFSKVQEFYIPLKRKTLTIVIWIRNVYTCIYTSLVGYI